MLNIAVKYRCKTFAQNRSKIERDPYKLNRYLISQTITIGMAYIYVLELTDHKYYVGKTDSPIARITDHMDSDGAQWTKLYKPIEIIEVKRTESDFEEDQMTLKYMKKYGIFNVRGGSFVQLNLSDEEKSVLTKMLCTESDSCFKCGGTDHYANRCNASDHLTPIPIPNKSEPASKFGTRWTDADTEQLIRLYADTSIGIIEIAEIMGRGKAILVTNLIKNHIVSTEQEIRGIEQFDSSDYAQKIREYYSNKKVKPKLKPKLKNLTIVVPVAVPDAEPVVVPVAVLDAEPVVVPVAVPVVVPVAVPDAVSVTIPVAEPVVVQSVKPVEEKKSFFRFIKKIANVISDAIETIDDPNRSKRSDATNEIKKTDELQTPVVIEKTREPDVLQTPAVLNETKKVKVVKKTKKVSKADTDEPNRYVCYRCGRQGHFKEDCYAKTHLKGYYLS